MKYIEVLKVNYEVVGFVVGEDVWFVLFIDDMVVVYVVVDLVICWLGVMMVLEIVVVGVVVLFVLFLYVVDDY